MGDKTMRLGNNTIKLLTDEQLFDMYGMNLTIILTEKGAELVNKDGGRLEKRDFPGCIAACQSMSKTQIPSPTGTFMTIVSLACQAACHLRWGQ